MVTIDAHLHLREVPEHVPQWWVDEFYAPFGDVKYDSADGQVIVDKLDQAGIVQASDLRRTSFHPDHPGEHRHFVSNTYVAEEVAKFPTGSWGRPPSTRFETSRLRCSSSTAASTSSVSRA